MVYEIVNATDKIEMNLQDAIRQRKIIGIKTRNYGRLCLMKTNKGFTVTPETEKTHYGNTFVFKDDIEDWIDRKSYMPVKAFDTWKEAYKWLSEDESNYQ